MEFFRPTDVKTTLELLDQYKENAVIVNGGTDIVERLGKKLINPEAVIYIAGVEELKYIDVKDGELVLGGTVTYNQMLADPRVNCLKGFVESVGQLGSEPVRAMACPTGNLGTAAPSADCTAMLMGMGAKVHIVKKGGERVVPIEQFFIKTNKNVLEPGELIDKITMEYPQPGTGTGYIRLARRKAQDIAKVLVSANITVENGVCKRAMIGLGALNATAVRATSIEECIVGKSKEEALKFCEENFPKEAGLRASRFTHYKEQVTSTAVKRAVEMAWNEAEVVK